MRIVRLFAILLTLAAASPATAAEPPSPRAQVMVVGLFHFANPGRDMFNVHMDDVLAERRVVRDDYSPGSPGVTRAESWSFETAVSDGVLDIEFHAVDGDASVAAILIEKKR